MSKIWDVIVIGGGTTGLPTAIFAAARGAEVLVIEAAKELGGTLHLSMGQMSAAGTALQEERNIEDTPKKHFDDVMRISKNTADPDLVKLAVDNAAAAFDWLMDNGYQPIDGHPVHGQAHEPYSERRYYWGEEFGISILNTIRPLFDEHVSQGRIKVLMDTKVTELLQDNYGAVIGVKTDAADGTTSVAHGQNIVIATGGYAANPLLFEQLSGVPLYWNGAHACAKGDGLVLGQSVGGWLRGHDNYYCGYGAILSTTDAPAEFMTTRAICHPHMRMPWEIHVNLRGERFFAEDTDSVDFREQALLKQPLLRSWIVYDQNISEAAPALLHEHNKEQANAYFGRHPMFFKADSLEDLARVADIDARGLKNSVLAYNHALKTKATDPFGRKYRPVPIEKPPFFSIRTQGTSVVSTVGLAVDKFLRVIDGENKPIANLYAAGEMLGSGQTMGAAACGGMMVTPALTFGRLLGHELLNWKNVNIDAAQ